MARTDDEMVRDLYLLRPSIRDVVEELGPPWTFWKVREALKRTSSLRQTKADKTAVLAHYAESRSTTKTAAEFGISAQTVANYAKAEGVRLEAQGGVRLYRFDEAFFESYTPASCYWAGFLAADGNLYNKVPRGHGSGRVIQIMLAQKDHAHLEAFARSVRSEHPVHEVMVAGVPESQFRISSRRWWVALHENFNLESRKSLILKPPPDMPRALTWHYIRGYFDGDGCVEHGRDPEGRPKQISFVSGSLVFVEWLRAALVSHHKVRQVGAVWRLSISGPLLRAVVPLLYAGSTPDTRLARKYELLKRWL